MPRTGPKQRPEEAWAAACLELALPGVDVRHHDDGSRSSMYDLDLVRNGVLAGICEVTSATDGVATASWNRLNGTDQVLVVEGLKFSWLVEVSPSRKERRLEKELPILLGLIEGHDIRVQQNLMGLRNSPHVERLEELGVISLYPVATRNPGAVHFTVFLGTDRHGGAVPKNGDQLATWLSGWIGEAKQADNTKKLLSVAANERHIFIVFPVLSLAPFSVADVLCRTNAPLPTIDLQVPAGITHIWAASTWLTGDLLGWQRDHGWRRSPKPPAHGLLKDDR